MTNSDTAMKPVVVNGCFAWLHTPPHAAKNVAVLLCPGAGQDYLNGYRSLRVLADGMAQAGYPVLRFDYPGTGDSGDDHGPDLWPAWRRSVAEAADWLRQVTGARSLILSGLRIGATLAALEAASRDDVAGLVLFEPILHARGFVTQLVTESRLRRKNPDHSHAPDDSGSVTLGELKFSAADVAEMRTADLAQLSFSKPLPVKIFSQNNAAKLNTRLESWRLQEMKPSCSGFENFEALLRPNQHSGESEIDTVALLDWMDQEVPHGIAQSGVVALPAALKSENWEEKIIRFGKNARLAGMLCRPRTESTMAVLIGNSGGNPRHGFARFGVVLARALAAAGIASFRFDFPGLGDSVHLENAVDTQSDVFLQDRTEDFSAAIDALEPLGIKHFAVHGLCSGAFHAVQAARSEPRIETLATVNLPWFTLRHDAPGVNSAAQKAIATFRQRNMRVLFLFSTDDAGFRQFERHFGTGGSELGGDPRMRIVVSDIVDHELTERWMQDIAIRDTIGFLQAHAAGTARNIVRREMPGNSSREA